MRAKENDSLQKAGRILAVLLAIVIFITIIPVSAQAATSKKLKKTNVTLKYTTTVYTGKAKKPAVTVKVGKKTLKKNKDYKVSYKANKKVGTATVTVKGIGKYTGSVEKTFKILPKGSAVTTIQAGPGSFLVKWKLQKKQTSGYEIRYSTDKNFKRGVKTIRFSSRTVGSRKVTGLLPETTYYVQVRTYKMKAVESKKYIGMLYEKQYSSKWSKAKAVTTEAVTDADKDQTLTTENARIVVQLLKERIKAESEKRHNFMISPFSLYVDLAMATNGAEGETLKELEEYLGIDIEKANELISRYSRMLPQNVQVANSIWVNEAFGLLNPDFQKLTKETYKAEIENVPYSNETVKRINAWVKKNTHDMIPSIIDRLYPDQVMVLLNAVVFEGEWETPYELEDIIENEKFKTADGKKETCTMLYSTEEEYVELKDKEGNTIAYGFLKPYADGQTAFLGILPEKGKTTDDVLAALDGESYTEMFNGKKPLEGGEIYAGIPEFKLDDEMELNPYLKNAGVNRAFSEDAQFGKMMQSSMPVYFDSVIQKTHIEVDRHGTKAAAVTGIIAKAGAAPINKNLHIYLNRPFVYAIVDIENGMPFFMGVQSSIQ